MISKAINYLKDKISFMDVLICLFLGYVFTDTQLIFFENESNNYNIYYKAMCLGCVFLLCTILGRCLIIALLKKKDKNNFLKKIFNQNKYLLFRLSLIIFLCWLPILIMLYPGTCINDTWGQLQQIISLKNGVYMIGAHHPILDTVYMSSIILPIVWITNNWHLAMFFYVILQAVLTSGAFAYSLVYGKNKLKLNNMILCIFLLIYCFIPVYAFSVQTIGKDSIFSWIYVLFSVYYIELIRTKGECIKDNKYMIKFCIIILLCILTKKVGIYIIICSLGISLIYIYKKWKRVLSIILSVSMIMFVFLPITYKILRISKSGKQEMYSMLFQQTARYVKYNKDDVTEEEKNIINKVLDYENLDNKYIPINADPVKEYHQRGEGKDYVIYLKVWFSQGMKKPEIYLDATKYMLAGWFSFYEYKPLTNMECHDQIDPKLIPESVSERDEKFVITSNNINKYYDGIFNTPILKIIVTYGFYATLLPTFVIMCLIRNKKKIKSFKWLVAIPMVLSIIIGCWLAPVSVNAEGLRYLYPVVYSLPCLLMWCFYSEKEQV